MKTGSEDKIPAIIPAETGSHSETEPLAGATGEIGAISEDGRSDGVECLEYVFADALKQRKAELRSLLRAKRKALCAEERDAAALAVAERVMGMEEYINAKLLLAYMPARGELDVLPIVRDAWAKGKRVAFPLCTDNGGLRLLIPDAPDAFSTGTYGILEPDTSRSLEVFPDELDLVIVPAVAFGIDCERLGQGGGYYDRLLKNTHAFTVGVGYNFQLIDGLPVEEHDIGLDCVAVPAKLIRCTRSRST